jgi:hypothetical protein
VLFYFYVVAVAVCAPGIYYLMMSPMEKDEFFLTRWLAERLFPQLDRQQRQHRLQLLIGLLMAVFASAALTAFLINRFGRG